MKHFSRARSAFTLVELLVVIAIIGVLISLLLPAVQKVRVAAFRMQDVSNMRQIGIACHAFADVNGWLPTKYDQNSLSAFAQILPFIEGQWIIEQANTQNITVYFGSALYNSP